MIEFRLFGEVRALPEVLETDPASLAFEDFLVRRGNFEPGEARSFVRELIGYVTEELGARYGEAIESDLDALFDLRRDLARRYGEVLDVFSGRRGPVGELPERLRPEAFRQLFDEVNTHLDALQDPSSIITHASDSPLLAGVEDLLPRPGEGESPVRDPAQAGGGVDPIPEPRVRQPGIHEQQRVELDYYRDALQSWEDPLERRRAQIAARAIANRYGFPADWDVAIRRIPEYGYTLEQIVALSERDPTFAGRGFEMVIRVPEGTSWAPRGRAFAPDGIQIGPRGFTFLEYKTSFAPEPAGFYSSEAGAEALLGDMEMRARMANEIPGCGGWTYHTGQGWLDVRIGDLIGRFELEHPDLEGLIHAPAGGVE